VCSTGVDEALMKEEFDKLSAALIQGAATCSPPLPLTTIVVQVKFSQLLQNYDLWLFLLASFFLLVKRIVCCPVKAIAHRCY